MNFQANLLLNPSTAPRTVSVQVGRFQVVINRAVLAHDKIEWAITNAREVFRAEDSFPAAGKISQHNAPLEEILLLLDQLASYERHLAVEDEVAANPAKYLKIAEAEQKAEQKAQAEADKAAAEQEAAAAKARLEAEAEAQREAEQAAEQARKDEAARLEAEKQAKLAQRIRAAAARELGSARHV